MRSAACFARLLAILVVGHPVAVNPETRLAAIARKRGWLVEEWEKAAGAPKKLLPLAPMMNERQR